MKKILITGAGSYIGVSFERYLSQWPKEYQIDTVDMIDGSWRLKNFCGYDVVFHVAGIAHQKETRNNAHLYYEVNRDLAVEVYRKAVAEKVKQFVFLSTANVYGMVEGVITPQTVPCPKTNYGKSKYEAELIMQQDSCGDTALAILRPPMVYGDGCKGNYDRLRRLAKKIIVFPNYPNKRSTISVENLAAYVKKVIDLDKSGIFFPQDPEYACTTQIVRELAAKDHRKIWFTVLFNPLIHIFRIQTIKKMFGDLYYEGME